MAVTQVVEIARAEVSDDYRVTLWQRGEAHEYSTEDARALAAEMVSAADEADRLFEEDGKETIRDMEVRQMRERLAAKDQRAGVI